MSDRAALLTAICATPDDDTARLVYADWLDEHGEAKRAAHIRAQIESHRLVTADTAANAVAEYLSGQYDDSLNRIDWSVIDVDLPAQVAARKADRKRAFKLRAKAEGVPQVKGVIYENNERGFFDEVVVYNVDTFLKDAGAIFRAAPISRVNFQQLTAEQAEEFVAAGHLARLRAVEFYDGVEADAIRAFGTHPDAAGVRLLEIGSNPDEAASVVEALAAGKHWTGLEELALYDLENGDEEPEEGQMAALFARPQFRNLRKLNAWGSCSDDDAAKAIIKNMPELRELDLSLNPLANGIRIFAGAKNLRHLRDLDLSTCDMEGDDPAPLIASPNLPNLTVLELGSNSLRGPSPKALAKPGRGPTLRVLELEDAEYSAAGVEALAKCPAARGLWSLSLQNTNFGDEHAERFARAAAFERLVYLNLSNNNITSRGAIALAAWPGAASLQWLDISHNTIREPGARALAASPHLAGLKYLRADGRGTDILKKRFKKVFS